MYRCESSSVASRVRRIAGACIGACIGAASTAACGGGGAAAVDVSARAAESPLHRGALTDYVPAAGLRWLVAGSPKRLAREPGLASLRQRWLTEERRRAFALETGVDLFATERALAAGFDLGTLYMADASGWRARPEVAFARRLAGSERLRQPHPRLWHVMGVVGTEPEALVRVSDDLVAVAVSDVTLARVVEMRALGRLGRVAAAFDGAALSELPKPLLEPAALSFYLPGPIERALGGSAGLLGAAHAFAATLEPEAGRLELALCVAGRWEASADAARLREEWDAFAASALGRRLALDRPLRPAEVRGSERLLELETTLDAVAFSAGVEGLLVGDLDDLVAYP